MSIFKWIRSSTNIIPDEIQRTSTTLIENSDILLNNQDSHNTTKLKEELISLRQYHHSIIESVNIWLNVLDIKGNVLIWNNAAEKISGYSKEEVLGSTKIWEKLYPDKHYRNKIFSMAMSIIEEGLPVVDYETNICRKNGEIRTISWNSKSILDINQKSIGSIALGRDITKRKIVEEELKQSYLKTGLMLENTIIALGTIVESRDPYTSGHQQRVQQLSIAIAKEMNLPFWQVEGIRMASLVHDIGKIAVPSEILAKPTKLRDDEFSIIKIHPTIAYEILKDIDFDQPVAEIALQHHERLDGSGYPIGLSNRDILIESKILSVSDVVEAISSHRPYRPALGIDVALDEITKGRNSKFDSDVVEACIKLFKHDQFKFK